MDNSTNTSESAAAGVITTQTYSEKELKLLLNVVLSASSIQEIDWDRLQLLGGFNTRKTATNNWGALKKKLEIDRSKVKAEKTPVQSPTKKRGVTDNNETEGEQATPKKKIKARRPTKKAVGDDENHISIKPELTEDMVV